MKIGIIGCGNMAEAIVRGLLKNGLYSHLEIIATDVRPERLKEMTANCKIETTENNQEAIERVDVVILAVKPQVMHGVLEEIKPKIKESHLIISIAAGVRLERIETILPKARLIRVMPNTPGLIGCGISAFSSGKAVTKEDEETASRIFSALGDVVKVEEKLMDAVCALSGSGPAYIFLIIESLIAAGVKMGLSYDLARRLVLVTVEGSAKLVKETGKHPAELRDNVTSPGGTTAAALYVMEEEGLRGIIQKAVLASEKRANELK
ncbi:MAG: pyrroline-5-carboxylate reductase [bacterium]|nr:pyrroline-5-carboxylate reductase [bacterium]